MLRVKLAAGALVALLAASANATLVYDGFTYPVGNLGGNVNTFANPPETWTLGSSGTSPVDIQVSASGLDYTGANGPYAVGTANLPTAAGGSAVLTNNHVYQEKIGIGGAVASGNLYYSMLVKVSDLTGAVTGATGSFIAGFNNSPGNSTATVTQAGARLRIRKSSTDATKYNFGIENDITSAGTSPNVFETTDRAVGDTVFVVAEYVFNQASQTDDVANLWINPDPTTFGSDTGTPAPALSTTGADINQLQIQSFFLRQNGSAPKTISTDELRIGTDWAGVTSTTPGETLPEPASLSLIGLGAIGLLKRRRSPSA